MDKEIDSENNDDLLEQTDNEIINVSEKISDEQEKLPNEVEFSKQNEELNDAVDKIVNEESDELLDAQDEELERQFEPKVEKKNIFQKINHLYFKWWNHKKLRNTTLVVFFIGLILIIIIPHSRYQVLNLVGVRVSSSMIVVDSMTGLPLENIPVKLQEQEIRSNEEGKVEFNGLKLGNSNLVIDKLGYAEFDKNITLGLGSNPIGNQPIQATGTQFTFVLSDWLSGKTISTDAEAASGEDKAISDDEGKIVLTVGLIEDDSTAEIMVKGYRIEKFKLSELSQDKNEVKMIPEKKHVFVSNRDGNYDLYKTYVNGENEEILLKATGQEREVPFALPHQTQNVTAYISSRLGEQNKEGFILDGLFVIDIGSGDVINVARSEQLQIIGWVGDKLIYVAVSEGASGGSPERSKLISFDIKTQDRKELATSNYFNDVKLVNEDIFYSASSYAVPNSEAKLFSIDANGENLQKVVDTQVWSIIRTDYENLLFNAVDLQWYEMEIGGTAEKLNQQPTNKTSRQYTNSPNGEQSLWVDIRDGRGVLLKYDIKQKKDDVIQTIPGLENPVYWLSDNSVVFRVFTSSESADYIVNIEGGEPQKIADVIGNRSKYFY